MHFRLADLQKISPGFDPGIQPPGVPHDFGKFRARTSTDLAACGDFDADPAMPCFTETDEIAADFFRGIDRQSVTGGTVLHAADQNADHFAFEVEKGAPASPRCVCRFTRKWVVGK